MRPDMGRETIEARYWKAINEMPVRGGGLHQYLPRITNYGVMLGLPCEQVESDTRIGNPSASAGLRRNEISEAYAFSSRNVQPMDFDKPYKPDPYAKYASKRNIAKTTTAKLKPSAIFVEATVMDIIEASPIRLLDDPKRDGRVMLECLYHMDEFVFIGDTYSTSENVMTVEDWLAKDISRYPFIMLNPLTGEYGHTSEGKESKRCEEAVKVGRYLLLEMDDTPRDEQVGIAMGMIEHGYPVALIVDSGNKSLHVWLRVDCPKEKWETDVRRDIFEAKLSEFGIDPACKNISRLSRLGGHVRGETNRRQNIYYLREV